MRGHDPNRVGTFVRITKADREMAATVCAILASQVIWEDNISIVSDELEASETAYDLATEAWWKCRSFDSDHHASYGECEAVIRTGWTPS